MMEKGIDWKHLDICCGWQAFRTGSAIVELYHSTLFSCSPFRSCAVSWGLPKAGTVDQWNLCLAKQRRKKGCQAGHPNIHGQYGSLSPKKHWAASDLSNNIEVHLLWPFVFRSEEPVVPNMDISTGHVVLVSMGIIYFWLVGCSDYWPVRAFNLCRLTWRTIWKIKTDWIRSGRWVKQKVQMWPSKELSVSLFRRQGEKKRCREVQLPHARTSCRIPCFRLSRRMKLNQTALRLARWRRMLAKTDTVMCCLVSLFWTYNCFNCCLLIYFFSTFTDDHTRIVLKENFNATGSDYINASAIVSFSESCVLLWAAFELDRLKLQPSLTWNVSAMFSDVCHSVWWKFLKITHKMMHSLCSEIDQSIDCFGQVMKYQ